MAFTSVVDIAGLTLYAGDLVLTFPAELSADTNFTLEDLDAVGWTDGETIPVRLVRGAPVAGLAVA